MSDTISRRQAIEALRRNQEAYLHDNYFDKIVETDIETLTDLPSAEPEIIYCRKCKFASGDSRICMKFGHSPIGELDFCAWAERRTDEQTKD